MRKPDTAEELKPSFRRIFGQLKQNCALLFDRTADEWPKVVMQWCGVYLPAFAPKTYGSSLQVDIAERSCSFRQTCALSHGHQPAIAHPFVLMSQCVFDGPLFFRCYLRFDFRRLSLQSEPNGGIGGDVATPDGFLHDCRKHFELRQRCIKRTTFHEVLRWSHSESWVFSAQLICDLRRRNDVAVGQIRAERRPRVGVARNGLWVRVSERKKLRNPSVKSVAPGPVRKFGLSHRFFSNALFYLPSGAFAVDANAGRLTAPCSIGFLESNPVVWTAVTNVFRSHECSMA